MTSVPGPRSGGGAPSGHCGAMLVQIEIDRDDEREAGALDQHEAEVPHQVEAGAADAVQRQLATGRATTRSFIRRPPACPSARTSRSARSATGIEPQTTAQGVKIEPISMTVVASAVQNGQIELRGEDSRACGSRLGHAW